jgi:hypothetical protein
VMLMMLTMMMVMMVMLHSRCQALVRRVQLRAESNRTHNLTPCSACWFLSAHCSAARPMACSTRMDLCFPRSCATSICATIARTRATDAAQWHAS